MDDPGTNLSDISEDDDSDQVHLPGHARVGVAILKCLQVAGGSAHRTALYGPVAEAVGPLSPTQLSKKTPAGVNSWVVRVNFSRLYLANSGLLRNTGKGVWSITPAGEEALKSPDVLGAVRAAYKAYKQGKAAGAVMAAAAPASPPGQQVIAPVGLIDLAAWTSDPKQFEAVLAGAFADLGFEASHIGGSGDTDVLVVAHRANPPYSVVVDAKTTKHEKVGDSQIHWHHIAQHRKDRGADYAAVIAIGFHGGLVSQKAMEDKVALISAEDLQQVLQSHRLVAFSQDELRALFVPSRDGSPSLRELDHVATLRLSKRLLLLSVIRASADYLEGSDDAVTAEAVRAYLKAKDDHYDLAQTPSLEEVREALAFLSNPFVGVLQQAGPTTYSLSMHPDTAVRRVSLIAIVRSANEVPLVT